MFYCALCDFNFSCLLLLMQAFCCIATGVYGFPNRRAAEIALSTVREWLDTGDNADKVKWRNYTTLKFNFM